MTHKYLNTEFKPGASVFTDLENSQPNAVTFASTAVTANVQGGKVPMVRGTVTLRNATQETPCGMECPVEVTESVSVSFNIVRGANHLTSLRAELDRLFEQAEQDYGLLKGHVPPSYATFSTP